MFWENVIKVSKPHVTGETILLTFAMYTSYRNSHQGRESLILIGWIVFYLQLEILERVHYNNFLIETFLFSNITFTTELIFKNLVLSELRKLVN